MKKRWICLLTVIGILSCGVTAAASSFPDVPDSAAYAEAAEYLSENRIMEGDTSGNFNPNNYVTRAQMAAIICRMLGETAVSGGSTDFSDVPASYWASGYIIKATELGFINGFQDGSFKPNNTVTYEQAVAMIVRALGYENEADALGGYPVGYLETAKELGLLNNINAQAGEALNRGKVAILFYNCYQA